MNTALYPNKRRTITQPKAALNSLTVSNSIFNCNLNAIKLLMLTVLKIKIKKKYPPQQNHLQLHRTGVWRGQTMLMIPPISIIFFHTPPPTYPPPLPSGPLSLAMLFPSPSPRAAQQRLNAAASHFYMMSRKTSPEVSISWGCIYSLALTLNTSILKYASFLTAKCAPAVLSFFHKHLGKLPP